MNDNSFYQVYFNDTLETKEQVYDFVSTIACPNHSYQKRQAIIDQLNEREKVGSPLIAEHVLLPHIESNLIKESQIIFLKLTNPISFWDNNIKDIRLIIIILLKTGEQEEVKKRISLFTRSLADEDYLERLLNVEEQSSFYKEIITF
ncbi:PTS sugar transporter subunit IIA [Amphibacillus sp. Q70]|uniref:PTS sugar transporter subunit IIA n=1 Tax=Amphibacillus sp. Q70 TaxID=3453416 RepID=UPI003F87D63F